ncbi:hypothetical protein EZV62_006374 [Acer yangbiense]|uniref:Phospholipid/glycerol acyltransferase domain-containing protein n=1 Tax=Acer yangbiense TaxID=1000413 RepID=A0A5C7I8Q5_9ROSI|nr:hypothetical protein EZV62_006374 [Acer yangbiense]
MSGVQRLDKKGDLWKNRARELQLRLRDRFHVAVERHRCRPEIFSQDGFFSSSVQRWLRLFHDFRRDSLPSSSVLYRKRVSEDLNAEEDSVILRMLQAVAVPVLGNVCHVFMNGLNRVQVYGVEKLHEALLNRPKNKPLITVSNHVASVDDPFVIASLLPPRVLLDAQNLRWTLCASDRCFKNPVTSAFFRSVKVLPVSRGEGIYQKGMDIALSKLNTGGWVHIFPEGSRSRDGGKTMGSSKRGVGRLVMDADNVPMVVPFVHSGMQEIMPVGASFPRIGKTVTVVIGDPIEFDDLVNEEQNNKHVSRGKLYDAVASRIGHRLQQLKVQVDKLALEQPSVERAMEMLKQFDWESLGMANDVVTEDGLFGQESQADAYINGSKRRVLVAWRNRIRGYMEPSELMGFAARGLFMNHLKSVLDDDQVYNESVSEAFPVYNKSHVICLPMPHRSGDVLVTSYGELEENKYLDPRTAQVATVDHVKQVCTEVRPASDEELSSPYIEEFRFALDAEILKYVGEAYPKGVCSVYCANGKDVEEPGSDFELVVVISATRLSPQNFCNGSWRSIWNIEFKDDAQVLELKGKLQVGAHYFEEGNVQLDAKHECNDSTIFQSPDDSAISIATIIRHHETEYLTSLEASYSNLPDNTFKDLRRKLPVTRTLFPWHNTSQFSLTREITKELGIEK